MNKYGTVFYRSIWTVILRHLPERYWYKLKVQNKAFHQLVKNSCSDNDTVETLILDGKIESLIKKNAILNFNYCLGWACQSGNMDMVQLMIEKGANYWNNGLHGACRGGKMDMIQLMIDKGASDRNRGLEGACQSGDMDIVQLMIDKGASDWNRGLEGACQSGNMDLVQLMIEKGATHCSYCNHEKHKN